MEGEINIVYAKEIYYTFTHTQEEIIVYPIVFFINDVSELTNLCKITKL